MPKSAVNEIPKWFSGQVAKLFAAYPAATISAATIPAWWEVLRRLGEDRLKISIVKATSKSPTFIPSAFSVLEASDRFAGLTSSFMASTSWESVAKLAQGQHDVKIDEIAAEVVRLMGGAKRLGMMDAEKFRVWGWQEFERLYREVHERQQDKKMRRWESERAEVAAATVVQQIGSGSR